MRIVIETLNERSIDTRFKGVGNRVGRFYHPDGMIEDIPRIVPEVNLFQKFAKKGDRIDRWTEFLIEKVRKKRG